MNPAADVARPADVIVMPRRECPVCANKPGISIVASHTCPQYGKIPNPEEVFEFFLRTLSHDDQVACRRLERRSAVLQAERGASDVLSTAMQQRGIERQQIVTDMRAVLDRMALPPQD